MKSNYNLSDLKKCWKKLSIKKGDTIYITGNLFFLGQYKNHNNILPAFSKSLRNAIGHNGTIAFPTHSWSLVGSKRIFSLKNTPSESGVLTEFLRKEKRSCRQFHPYSSISAIGPSAKDITGTYSRHAYGLTTPFDKLISLNAKFISIGMEPNLTCSQVHHAEIMANVPYRYTKEFNVLVERKKNYLLEKFYLFVLYNSVRFLERDRNKKFFQNFGKKITSYNLGKSKVYIYSMKEFYIHALKLIEKNPYTWLKKIPLKKEWT